jgi:hypothetical protein
VTQAAKLGHRDVGSSPTALTTELLLHWKPPSDGGLVAFVVLEQQVTVSGLLGCMETHLCAKLKQVWHFERDFKVMNATTRCD